MGITGELWVQCLRDNVVLPIRGSGGAAGYYVSAANNYVIRARGKGTIDTGVVVSLQPHTYTQIDPRPRLAAKRFIDVGMGSYRSKLKGRGKSNYI